MTLAMSDNVIDFEPAPLETQLAPSPLSPDKPCSTTEPAESSRLWAAWNPEAYAEEQIRNLVQQVFFPGWPKASRQVVLCGADQQAVTVTACARIAHTMAATLPGTVCAVDANLHSPALESALGPLKTSGNHTNGAIQVDHKLWFVPAHELSDASTGGLGAVSLRNKLSELRRRFDYSLIQAPPAEFFTETVLLGQLADGVILMLHARLTHGAVARRMQHLLRSANVPILGAVLIDRTFPIPERIYRKL
jgi:Mrp family chromosome partitioning ATPase